MGRVEFKLIGNEIAVTLRREVGQLARVRRITAHDAFALSMLMTTEAADQAVNLETASGVTLQIINRPYDEAWLGINDAKGGGSLVACLEGDLIRKVGQALDQVYKAAKGSPAIQSKPHAFTTGRCYIEQGS